MRVEKLQHHYYVKTVAFFQFIGLLCFFLGILGFKRLQIADGLFMVGLLGICCTVVDILLGAHLLAGWFRWRRKGETDAEYQAAKIDPHQVGRLKDKPLRFSRLGKSCLSVGLGYIVFSILLTW